MPRRKRPQRHRRKPDEERSCKVKVKHPNRETATFAMFKLVRQGAYLGMLHVYRCGFCRFWHVGHR